MKLLENDDPDRAAFELRLLEAIPKLRGYVRVLAARSLPGLEAEDLLQDLVARALRYREAHDASRELVPWLRTTALRLVIDARRRAARRPATLGGLSEEAVPAAPARPNLTALREELQGLLARLDPLPREVLLRFHRDGQSVREIARALQIPEGTVKSHLHRARRLLRRGAPRSP